MKAGGSEVQSHPQLFSKLEALLGYLKFCYLFTHTLLLSLSPNTHPFSPKLTAKKIYFTYLKEEQQCNNQILLSYLLKYYFVSVYYFSEKLSVAIYL